MNLEKNFFCSISHPKYMDIQEFFNGIFSGPLYTSVKREFSLTIRRKILDFLMCLEIFHLLKKNYEFLFCNPKILIFFKY